MKKSKKLIMGLLFLMVSNLTSLSVLAKNSYLDMVKGWPRSYDVLERQLDPNKSYLVILSETPEAYMDLRSLDNLRRSFLLATDSDKQSKIGHNAFGWSCPRTATQVPRGFTSQSGENSEQTYRMVMAGWGLNPLLTTFKDGILLDPEQNNQKTILPWIDQPRFKLFTMILEVSDQECERVIHFASRFATRSPKTGIAPFENFGLNLDPKKFEGGGCGSTSVSALSMGNFFLSFDHSFYRTLNIPKSLIGNPQGSENQDSRHLDSDGRIIEDIKPFSIEQKNHISPLSLVQNRWSSSDNDSISVRILDPEMLFLFYRVLTEETIRGSDSNLSYYTERMKREMKLRKRAVYVNPKSQMQVNHFDKINIDEDFDSIAHTVTQQAQMFYKMKVSDNYRFRLADWGQQVALIITK